MLLVFEIIRDVLFDLASSIAHIIFDLLFAMIFAMFNMAEVLREKLIVSFVTVNRVPLLKMTTGPGG